MYGQVAPSTSCGTSPPTASAAVAAAIPVRHHASHVRSAASRVRRVTSTISPSLIAAREASALAVPVVRHVGDPEEPAGVGLMTAPDADLPAVRIDGGVGTDLRGQHEHLDRLVRVVANLMSAVRPLREADHVPGAQLVL